MTQRLIELRSDTFTRPTEAMRRAMYDADVGDDVWGEDPTVQRLEEMAARLTGKEAGLFISSGTQGNLIGILSHVRTGDEVIVGDISHVFLEEAAGTAVVGGIQLRTIPTRPDGTLDPHRVAGAIRGDDIHWPRSGAVVLENTHNYAGGRVLSRDAMESVASVAHAAGIPVHLDGARVFNAVVALGVPAADLLAPVDSVTFCLSKGLGAPVGSMLCGPADYIERARKWRKMLGGGMRQVGVLAAPGIVALQHGIERLAEDNANARRLADGLAEIDGIEIVPETVESNIVFFETADGIDYRTFMRRLEARGVRVSDALGRIRAVTSYEVTAEDIDAALRVIDVEIAAMRPVAV